MRFKNILISYCSLLFAMLLMPLTFVDAGSISFTKNLAHDEGSFYKARAVFAVDLDEDGDMDIVVGDSYENDLLWYQNNGSEVFTEILIDNTFQRPEKIVVIDFDNDNDLDIVGSGGVSGLYWWKNNGSESFTENVIDIGEVGNFDVKDINGDGDYDIVGNDTYHDTYENGLVYWFDNDGNEEFFTKRMIDTSLSNSWVSCAADFDNDGDIDIASGGLAGAMNVYLNDSNEVFTESAIASPLIGAENFSCVDVDTDGDIDIVVGSYNNSGLSWYSNNGSGVFSKNQIVATGYFQDNIVIDMDADGDKDIVVADSGTEKIMWYDNSGSEVFTEKDVSTNDFTDVNSVYCADIDTDGDIDVVGGSTLADANMDLRWYSSVNSGPGIYYTSTNNRTTEAGSSVTYNFRLNTAPTDTVTIPFSSSDITEGTINNSSIMFTTENWSTPQALIITGVNDEFDDGNISYTLIIGAATSSDLNYNSINLDDLTLINEDNDTAGFSVGTISAHTTEALGSANFTISLTSKPTANVIIGLSSDDSSEGTVSPTSLTFTTDNWASPQTVTATGVNDDIDDGDVTYHIITAAATSSDNNYNALNPSDVTVINDDNDTAGISVSSLSGNGHTTEAGNATSFTILLNTEPTADVIINLSSDDSSEGTVSPTSLTFTTDNWASPQTVTATGVNDDIDDGDVTYHIITAAATSSDLVYNSINPSDTTVINDDNDTALITVSKNNLVVVEGGVTDSYTIVLNSAPLADVLINLSSINSEVVLSSSALTFTSSNWNQAQTILVTAIDDTDVESSQSDSITQTVSSLDSNYQNYVLSNITVAITDNDVAVTQPEPTPEENIDPNNNGIPDDYENIDPTNTNEVDAVVVSVTGASNGAINVNYINDVSVSINVFSSDTNTLSTQVSRFNNTAYYVVVQAVNSKLAIVNVLNGAVVSSKTISKKTWTKDLNIQIVTLRKKTWVLTVAKNTQNKNLVTLVNITSYQLSTKASANFILKSINVDKTAISKNKVLLKNNKAKVKKTYSLTKAYKLLVVE